MSKGLYWKASERKPNGRLELLSGVVPSHAIIEVDGAVFSVATALDILAKAVRLAESEESQSDLSELSHSNSASLPVEYLGLLNAVKTV